MLKRELDYSIRWKVIDGLHFVPQHRERVLIAGFAEEVAFDWGALRLPDKSRHRLAEVLHPEDCTERPEHPYTIGPRAAVDPRYTISGRLLRCPKGHAGRHRTAGNGFGYGLVNASGIARTLSACYYKDGAEILVAKGKGRNPRRLTPRECARLMGYPDSFRIPVSDTQVYRQVGNSVVVPLIQEVAWAMKPQIAKLLARKCGVAVRPLVGRSQRDRGGSRQ